MVSKVSQTEKEKYSMISLLCGSDSRKNKSNPMKKKKTRVKWWLQEVKGWGDKIDCI